MAHPNFDLSLHTYNILRGANPVMCKARKYITSTLSAQNINEIILVAAKSYSEIYTLLYLYIT